MITRRDLRTKLDAFLYYINYKNNTQHDNFRWEKVI